MNRYLKDELKVKFREQNFQKSWILDIGKPEISQSFFDKIA